jgi:hypothetical protein
VEGLTVVNSADPPKADQGQIDRLRHRREEFSFDEHGNAVSSLLEENARLRALALTLSTMILKFLDQK